MADITQAFAAAVEKHQAGDIAGAEQIYRTILTHVPNHPPTLCNLGVLLAAQAKYDEAGRCYALCLAGNPGYPDAHYNFANLYRRVGQNRQAVEQYQACLRAEPNHAGAHFNLGLAYVALNELAAGIEAFQHAIAVEPGYADAYNRLGDALLRNGQAEAGIEQFRQYVSQRPQDHRGYNNLGLGLANVGRAAEAVEVLTKAVALKPDYPDAHNTLGLAYEQLGKKDEAEAEYRAAVKFNPAFADAWSNLGTNLTEAGRSEEAIVALRKSLEVRPNAAPVHSNLLLTLNYSSSIAAEEVANEHFQWATLFVGSDRPMAPMPADRTPERRLRIGYISADFRGHTVAGFIEQLLTHHDRERYHITAYAHVPRPDDTTDKHRQLANLFRPIVGLSDDAAAAQIRADKIDILIDLSGHTAGNRLLVLAQRPAALQATLFGYPNTTGMKAVDYRITDEISDPPGTSEHLSAEKLLRLPGLAWVYNPPTEAPEVTPLPALTRKVLTFGCLNNAAKISDLCLATWAKLLAAIPASRLMLLAGQSQAGAKRLTDKFIAAGVARDRLEMVFRLPPKEYFEAYQKVDLALDPFPYNGGVTTCDALWMGVPVLAVAGRSYVSRQGMSVMTHVGLSEFVADTPERLVELAATWASNKEWLADIRAGLRAQMMNSPVCDGKAYVQSLETALRQAWRQRVA